MKLLKRIGISIITLALVAGVMSPAISAYAAEKVTLTFTDELQISNFIKTQTMYNGHSLRTIGGDWSITKSKASDYWVNAGYNPAGSDHYTAYLKQGVWTPLKGQAPVNDKFLNAMSQVYPAPDIYTDTDYNWNINDHVGAGQHLYNYRMNEGDIMPVGFWRSYNSADNWYDSDGDGKDDTHGDGLPDRPNVFIHHVGSLDDMTTDAEGWGTWNGVPSRVALGGNSTCAGTGVSVDPWPSNYKGFAYATFAKENGQMKCTGYYLRENYVQSNINDPNIGVCYGLATYPIYIPYCAICGERLSNVFFEALPSSLKDIKYIEITTSVLTYCRGCGVLDNSGTCLHDCKAISDNRYYIHYDDGTNDPEIMGRMSDTVYYYNESSQYEGNSVVSERYLKTNKYNRPGYDFLGWSLANDGTVDFAPGARIKDISAITSKMVNNDDVVTLYAVWGAKQSTVTIDAQSNNKWGHNTATVFGLATYAENNVKHIQRPANGDNKALDNAGNFTKNTIVINDSNIINPKGYQVKFSVNGTITQTIDQPVFVTGVTQMTTSGVGGTINTSYGSDGHLTRLVYTYDNVPSIDKLTLTYQGQSISLPNATNNSLLFVGWYSDPSFRDGSFIGTVGQLYDPSSDITLYARFADSNMEAKDAYYSTTIPHTYNNIATLTDLSGAKYSNNAYNLPNSALAINHATGAADVLITTDVPTGGNFVFETYYRLQSGSWQRFDVAGGTGMTSNDAAGMHMHDITCYTNGVLTCTKQVCSALIANYTSAGTYTYEVKSTGYYSLDLFGAQGQSNTTFTGGAGGEVKGTIYLRAGEVLTVTVGRMGSQGSSYYLEGGGATYVYKKDLSGNNELIMIAGGGGAASTLENGHPGGNTNTANLVSSSVHPADGDYHSGKTYYAGGQGYLGGKAGIINIHHHTTNGSLVQGSHLGSNAIYSRSSTCYSTPYSYRVQTGTRHVEYCGGASSKYGPMGAYTDWGYCPNCGRVCGPGCYDCCKWDEPIYSTTTGYSKSCSYSEGEVVSSEASYGGSSWYLNTLKGGNFSYNQGVKTGNGSFNITPVSVGLLEVDGRNTEVLGISMPDTAAPAALVLAKDTVGTDTYVTWNEPVSNGTRYEIKVEVYQVNDNMTLSHIKTCPNVALTETSAIAGYYYIYTDDINFNIANYIKNQGYTADYTYAGLKAYTGNGINITKDKSIKITDTTHTYLMIAPVDVAGNIGPTRGVETLKTNVGRVTFHSNLLEYQLRQSEVDPLKPTGQVTKAYAITGTAMNDNGKGYDGVNSNLHFGEAFPVMNTIPNCTFLGWNSKADGTGIWYSKDGTGTGTSYTSPKELKMDEVNRSNLPGQTYHLYAQWSEVVTNTISVEKEYHTTTTNGTLITEQNHVTTGTYTGWLAEARLKNHITSSTGAYTVGINAIDIATGTVRPTLNYYVAGPNTQSVTQYELKADVKSQSGTTSKANESNYHETYDLTTSLNIQGRFYFNTIATSRQNNTSIAGIPAGEALAIDKTPIKIKDVHITQDSLKNYTEAELIAMQAGGGIHLNTTITLNASDYADAANGAYINNKDTSGIKKVLIAFSTSHGNVVKEMTLVHSNASTLQGNVIDGNYSLTIDLIGTFPQDDIVHYVIYAIDEAGNVTNSNDDLTPSGGGDDPVGDVLNYDVITYIYNIVDKDSPVDESVYTDYINTGWNSNYQTAYFLSGDYAKVVTYSIGFTENLSFDFEEIGQACKTYIEDGKYGAEFNMGTLNDTGFKRTYSISIPDSTPEGGNVTVSGYDGLGNRSYLNAKLEKLTANAPNGAHVANTPYLIRLSFNTYIFPYVEMPADGSVKEAQYTVIANRHDAGGVVENIAATRLYYITGIGSEELHYRSDN